MPTLKWDESEFMECLEVFSEDDGYGAKFHYRVEKNLLTLFVTVWPQESVVRIVLREADVTEPLIEFALFVREAVEYIKGNAGEYLEFQDCVVAPSRFSYSEMGDMFNKSLFKKGLTIQLAIKPRIQIRHIRKW